MVFAAHPYTSVDKSYAKAQIQVQWSLVGMICVVADPKKGAQKG